MGVQTIKRYNLAIFFAVFFSIILALAILTLISDYIIGEKLLPDTQILRTIYVYMMYAIIYRGLFILAFMWLFAEVFRTKEKATYLQLAYVLILALLFAGMFGGDISATIQYKMLKKFIMYPIAGLCGLFVYRRLSKKYN